MLKQEGYDLMGAVFEVYNELGYGMAEEIYQSALEVELGLRGIRFTAQAELNVFFKGHLLTPKYRPDLLVFGEIVVELKALKELCSEHEAQLFNYMRIKRTRVGYLINFGKKGALEWHRFVVDDFHMRTKSNNGNTNLPSSSTNEESSSDRRIDHDNRGMRPFSLPPLKSLCELAVYRMPDIITLVVLRSLLKWAKPSSIVGT